MLKRAQAEPAGAVSSSTPRRNGTPDYHITQFRHARYNPLGPSRSSNCGPASLTMALVNLGLQGKPGNPQALIDQNRIQMTGRNDSSRWTTLSQVRQGARAAGGRPQNVSSLKDIEKALGGGAQIVLAGNPNAPGGYGSSNGISYSDGHFITVSSYDRHSGRYTINDPLSRKGALQISSAQLQAYMSDDNAVGVEGIAVFGNA